jgi:aminoglycoside phosphotransferase (APT) family kinase protein
LDRLRIVGDLDTCALRQIWRQALEARESTESCWLHGDLHARNVLVNAGVITGVVDWGDITSGDAATDVASVWMLLPESKSRHASLEHYQADADLVARAKGWAIFFGTVLLETGLVDHPRHAAMGAATLRRLGEDV